MTTRIYFVFNVVAAMFILSACEQPEHRSSKPEVQTASLVSKKINCAEVGWKFFDRVKKEEAEQGYSAYLEVRYAYSPKLETCLCSYERLFAHANPPFSHFVMWDTLSGKMLAHATTVAPATIPPFEATWRELMGIEREADVLRGVPHAEQ